MKFIVAFLLCLLYTGAFSKEDIIEKMASAVCDCLKENEKQPRNKKEALHIQPAL